MAEGKLLLIDLPMHLDFIFTETDDLSSLLPQVLGRLIIYSSSLASYFCVTV